jgi:broad specificity phosphatase PhoE
MKIFLIRHGESIQNIDDSIDIPDPDIYLTDHGIKQVEKTALRLKDYFINNHIDLDNARMWISPYLRTEQTADIINKQLHIKSIFQDPRLVEKDFGNFDGVSQSNWGKVDPITLKTMNKRYKSPRSRFFTRLPNGESPFDVYNRMSSFLETVYRDDNDPIFIVAHGDTIRCFIMRWLHKDVNWYFEEPNPHNASVILIDKDDNGKYAYKVIIDKEEVR